MRNTGWLSWRAWQLAARRGSHWPTGRRSFRSGREPISGRDGAAEKADRAGLATTVAGALDQLCGDQPVATLRIGDAPAPGALPHESIAIHRVTIQVHARRAHIFLDYRAGPPAK